MIPARCRIFNEFRKFSQSVLQYRTEWQGPNHEDGAQGEPKLVQIPQNSVGIGTTSRISISSTKLTANRTPKLNKQGTFSVKTTSHSLILT